MEPNEPYFLDIPKLAQTIRQDMTGTGTTTETSTATEGAQTTDAATTSTPFEGDIVD